MECNITIMPKEKVSELHLSLLDFDFEEGYDFWQVCLSNRNRKESRTQMVGLCETPTLISVTVGIKRLNVLEQSIKTVSNFSSVILLLEFFVIL